ncbi:MAG: HAD family hydrolase [Candidatus Buchananbacteria bacterium]|nr:HAD family hydrolase [Candidatus Buchananbacteria bacterium]
MKKVILFDFDGVIVDSFEAAYSIVEELELGFDRDYYRKMFLGNIYDSVDDHHKDSNNKVTDQDEWFNLYTKKLLTLPVIPGMVEALTALGQRYALVVVSSSITSPIHSYLELHNIHHLFDKVYGADVHRSKVEKMNMVLTEYGVTGPDCLFVTDTVGDLREAAKANIAAVAVTWGFHPKEYFADQVYQTMVEHPDDLVLAIDRYFKPQK